MSVNVPTTQVTVFLAEHGLGQFITTVELDDVLGAQNYKYSRSGVRTTSLIFERRSGTAQTPFETTSGTLTTVNSNAGGRDLDTWWPQVLLPRRSVEAGFDVASLSIWAYGHDIEVTATARAADTNTTIGTFTATINSTSKQHAEGTINIAWGSVHQGGSTANPLRAISVTVQAKHLAVGATGRIYGLTLASEILTASDFPDADP